jgi:Na+-transporting methylmalonyl-CoA/oxaloacetate decarboxylase gamma subunit
MFKKVILLISLIIKLKSKEFIMKKNSSENNEFNPYIFNFTLDNTSISHLSIFDTSNSYIQIQGENVTNDSLEHFFINENKFYYIITNNISDKDYFGIVGISNKDKITPYIINHENIDQKQYSYLSMLESEKENTGYINFIQKENNEAIMSFGKIERIFNQSSSRICQCNDQYWSCEISTLKVGGKEIYSTSDNNKEYGIFSISEENIIAPYSSGKQIIEFYKNKIEELFGITCNEAFTCEYFNYEDLPDLSFVMKGGIGIMALSIDLFKILDNYTLEFKIKLGNKNDKSNNWYLGEPVVKNYNFLLNYSKGNANLTIIPSSLSGFILIIVACVGGFLFLFIFIMFIYCMSKKEKQSKKFTLEKFDNNKYGDEVYFGKDTIHEKIEENEEKEEKEEEDEKSDNNDKGENENNKILKKNDSDSDSNSENDIEIKNYIEKNKLENYEEESINEDSFNIGNGIINDSFTQNNLDNLIKYNNNSDNNIINNNTNNNSEAIHVELSLNKYGDRDNDENEIFIKKNK